jgi:hypothetical protein
MSDYSSESIRLPADYSDFVSVLSSLDLSDLVVHALPLKSVAEYSISQHGESFPQPSRHFVIADYLIDLPIIAVDLDTTSPTYSRVLGYCYGDWWIVGASLSDFAQRLKHGDSALYGPEN